MIAALAAAQETALPPPPPVPVELPPVPVPVVPPVCDPPLPVPPPVPLLLLELLQPIESRPADTRPINPTNALCLKSFMSCSPIVLGGRCALGVSASRW